MRNTGFSVNFSMGFLIDFLVGWLSQAGSLVGFSAVFSTFYFFLITFIGSPSYMIATIIFGWQSRRASNSGEKAVKTEE